MKQAQFNRPDTMPGKPMWCERQYPPIQGVPHPCPFDYWDGEVWRPGMPDNRGDVFAEDMGMGLAYIATTKASRTLPWRKAANVILKPESMQ